MSKRIYVGPLNGTMSLRITPPGHEADNIASPAVFDSNGDYLKVHSVIDVTLNRSNDQHWGIYSFPALGYCPIAFPSITHASLNRVFYPNDKNPATAEMNNFWKWGVQSDRVWVYSDTPNNYGGNYRFRCLIFKNRADRYIAA